MKHQWSRRRASAVVLAAAAVALGVSAVPGTSAQELVPGVVDVQVTLASKPTVVSPPGALVLIEATVTQGVVGSAGVLSVTLPAGSGFRPELSPGCTGAGVAVSCAFGATGGTFEIVSNTPTTAGTKTTAASVTATDPLLAALEYTANNSASVTTSVTTPAAGVAAGLVTEGNSLTLKVADGREYTMKVPQGVPGVIVTIRAEDGGLRTCGLATCGDGFVTDFVQHPVYKAEDPNNPLETDKTFGSQPPCQGLGGGVCSDIYFAKSAAAVTLAPMPLCPGAGNGDTPGSGQAIPSPCINQKYKIGTRTWFDVRMLSNDPIELPLSKLTG